jgi:hypothetical protein
VIRDVIQQYAVLSSENVAQDRLGKFSGCHMTLPKMNIDLAPDDSCLSFDP